MATSRPFAFVSTGLRPRGKTVPVLFALPALSKAEDAAKGFAAIAAAVASGELTPNEAGERPLIEIDHYGQRFIGCIECNRWGFRGCKRLFMELPEEELEALRRIRKR
jgi:hypothetical protein